MGAYAIAQYLDQVSGAVYVGTRRDGDVQFHVYWRDAKPIVIAWSDTEPMLYDFKTTKVSAEDLYGKTLDCGNGKLVIGPEPVYITSIDKAWAIRSVYEYTLDEAKDLCDYYAVMMGKTPEFNMKEQYLEPNYYEEFLEEIYEGAQGYEFIKEHVFQAVNRLEQITDGRMPSAEEAKNLLDTFYAIGDDFIKAYQEKVIVMPEREFFGLLFGIQNMAENAGDLYMAALDCTATPVADAYGRGQKIDKRLSQKEKQVSGGLYTFSRAMLKYAEEFAKTAVDVSKKTESNPQKNPIIISRNEMANRIMNWVEAAEAFEAPGHGRLMLQMLSPSRKLYNFEKNQVEFSLYNFGKQDFNGEIRLLDKENNLVLHLPAQMEAGKSGKLEAVFELKNTTDDPTQYKLQLLEGEDVIYEEEIKDVKIQDQLGLTLKNSQQHLEEMDSVVFEVENYYDGPQTIELEVEPPQGWSLADNTVTVELDSKETKEIPFKITKRTKTPYHEYYFKATAKKQDAVLSDSIYPLNFTLASFTTDPIDPAAWNGDISGWESAYPVYISPPENPQDEQNWKEDRMAMRAYARWDEKYFYLMARVNDDIHLNYQTGDYIWNGDSVQLAIDADHNKTTSFMPGDHEYVFALTDTGLVAGGSYGKNEAFSDITFNVVRKEEEHMTYYLIRLPKETVSPMQLQTGTQFGLNLAINDADYIAREYMDELTYGTIYAKEPVSYYTWSLTGQE